MLHSLLAASLWTRQTEKNEVLSNGSSHGGTDIVSCFLNKKAKMAIRKSDYLQNATHSEREREWLVLPLAEMDVQKWVSDRMWICLLGSPDQDNVIATVREITEGLAERERERELNDSRLRSTKQQRSRIRDRVTVSQGNAASPRHSTAECRCCGWRLPTAVGLTDRDRWVWLLRYFASFLASLCWHEVGHLATHKPQELFTPKSIHTP